MNADGSGCERSATFRSLQFSKHVGYPNNSKARLNFTESNEGYKDQESCPGRCQAGTFRETKLDSSVSLRRTPFSRVDQPISWAVATVWPGKKSRSGAGVPWSKRICMRLA